MLSEMVPKQAAPQHRVASSPRAPAAAGRHLSPQPGEPHTSPARRLQPLPSVITSHPSVSRGFMPSIPNPTHAGARTKKQTGNNYSGESLNFPTAGGKLETEYEAATSRRLRLHCHSPHRLLVSVTPHFSSQQPHFPTRRLTCKQLSQPLRSSKHFHKGPIKPPERCSCAAKRSPARTGTASPHTDPPPPERACGLRCPAPPGAGVARGRRCSGPGRWLRAGRRRRCRCVAGGAARGGLVVAEVRGCRP